MMLCVVGVEEGGFVPGHPRAGAHLGQAGQARPDALAPVPGGGSQEGGLPRGEGRRADQGELSPYDVGQPGQQVEPESPGAQ